MEDTNINKSRFENTVVQYSRVWEDWELLQEALEVNEHDVILSVTGAGDNTLNLLLDGPQTIVSVDCNQAQSALLELKLSAIRQLNHSEFLEVIGIKPSQQRKELYHSLNLPFYAKAHWDQNMDQLEAGVACCGEYDQYLESIQKTHLSKCLDNESVDLFLESKTLEEQRNHFRNWPMGDLYSLFRDTIADDICASLSPIRADWDPSGSKLDIDDVTSRLVRRFARVCQNIPVTNNIYLDLFLRSSRASFREVEHKLPPYLKPENFDKLKGLVDRVQVTTGSLEQVVSKCKSATFSKVNLSNICEVLSAKTSNKLFELLAEKMFKGGRLVHWTMFEHRSACENLSQRFKSHQDLAKSLSLRDKLFLYNAFYVEEII